MTVDPALPSTAVHRRTPTTSRTRFDTLQFNRIVLLACGCLLVLVLTIALVGPETAPPLADRSGNLGVYLDDPFVKEIPDDGNVVLRPEMPSAANVSWEISFDYGATYQYLRDGHELTITAADVGDEGLYLRAFRTNANGRHKSSRPYFLIRSREYHRN
ncbi:hypothetical protein [Tianweitania sp.]|uniref:hypothetical protein n=1 Tax=Tianweitania sp. TaxID=2021634 RepID=UPI00289D2838|nr:hypothetical protein [Tianweitania sp.]